MRQHRHLRLPGLCLAVLLTACGSGSGSGSEGPASSSGSGGAASGSSWTPGLSAATTVVLGTRKVAIGEDGRTLQFETDIAVLDETGDPLVSLPETAFELGQWDCGWGGCIAGPDGREAGGWTVQSTWPEKFGLVPGKARSPFAVAFLLDLGDGVRKGGEEPRRSEAMVEFLQGFGGNDRALLASFGGRDDGSAIQPTGEFVTDGRLLVPFAQDLPGRIAGQSSLADAIEPMLDYLQERSPALPTTMVVVGGADPGCGGGLRPSCQGLAEYSRAAGIPIATMMESRTGVEDIAHLTGGVHFTVDFPGQYRAALRGLPAVLGGEIAFYRMRFTLRLDHADMLAAGNMLHASIRITLSESYDLHAPIALAL